MATVDQARGDVDGQIRHLERAVEIYNDLDPRSAATATTLEATAAAHRAGGDINLALSYLQRALDIRNEIDPGSTRVARVLANIGQLHLKRKEADQALVFLERALAVAGPARVGALEASPAFSEAWAVEEESLQAIGAIQLSRGDLDRALLCLERPWHVPRLRRPEVTAGSRADLSHRPYPSAAR